MKTLQASICWLATACFLLAGALAAQADSGGSLPESGSDAWQIVVNDIAGQVVVLLPEDIHFRILGIGDIQGDDNTLTEALTTAIRSATDFHLIERADLDKLLKEQGIQLSPLSDPNGLVEPGKIKGVEGLLLGRVIKKVQSPFYSSLQVFLKLDNVETGNVVFARNFEASYIPATTWYLAAFVLFLFFFLLLRGRGRKKRTEHLLHYSEKEAADRRAIEAELKKSRDNLVRAHDLLLDGDKGETATLVRQQREGVADLLQKLEHGPVVHPDDVDRTMEKELNQYNKTMKTLVEKVRASSERVLELSRRDSDIEPELTTMAARIKDAANMAYDRPAGRG